MTLLAVLWCEQFTHSYDEYFRGHRFDPLKSHHFVSSNGHSDNHAELQTNTMVENWLIYFVIIRANFRVICWKFCKHSFPASIMQLWNSDGFDSKADIPKNELTLLKGAWDTRN